MTSVRIGIPGDFAAVLRDDLTDATAAGDQRDELVQMTVRHYRGLLGQLGDRSDLGDRTFIVDASDLHDLREDMTAAMLEGLEAELYSASADERGHDAPPLVGWVAVMEQLDAVAATRLSAHT